jgi:Papain family cysteine protease
VLSDQNIIDCNTYDDDCSGGWPLHAFEHMKFSGVADGEAYKYVQEKRQCQASTYPPILKVPNACEVELKGDENRLMRIVAQYGPVVSVIYVVNSMYQYKGGVFYEGANCPSYLYNHAVIRDIRLILLHINFSLSFW